MLQIVVVDEIFKLRKDNWVSAATGANSTSLIHLILCLLIFVRHRAVFAVKVNFEFSI